MITMAQIGQACLANSPLESPACVQFPIGVMSGNRMQRSGSHRAEFEVDISPLFQSDLTWIKACTLRQRECLLALTSACIEAEVRYTVFRYDRRSQFDRPG